MQKVLIFLMIELHSFYGDILWTREKALVFIIYVVNTKMIGVENVVCDSYGVGHGTKMSAAMWNTIPCRRIRWHPAEPASHLVSLKYAPLFLSPEM